MEIRHRAEIVDNSSFCGAGAVRTGIIEPHARTLELLLLVWSDTFFFFFCLKLALRGSVVAVLSPLHPRGISDVVARGSIIPVLYCIYSTGTKGFVRCPFYTKNGHF